ncbi:substrate-binding domain-containing protein [Microbacterium sp. LWH12-1.2]|uniref:substrate-binding domain-containing protein n=1 Tax=Microbacterium sp. LWH12-1.2 TaxID=3135259 RepID=UPI0034282465
MLRCCVRSRTGTWSLRCAVVQARPGTPVARLVADGEVDIGFQRLSETIEQDGIRILGVLPPGCAIETVFGGGGVATATATATADPAAALSVLSFFCSAAAATIKRMHGFDDASVS